MNDVILPIGTHVRALGPYDRWGIGIVADCKPELDGFEWAKQEIVTIEYERPKFMVRVPMRNVVIVSLPKSEAV